MQNRRTIRALTDEVKKLTNELEQTFAIVKTAEVLKAERLLSSLNSKLKRQDAVIYDELITIEATPKLSDSVSKQEVQAIITWAEKALSIVNGFMPATELEEKKIADKEQRNLAEEKAETDRLNAEREKERKKLEESQKEVKKVEAPKAAIVEEKKQPDRSIELMELAEQMPKKYKELTSAAKRFIGKIPGVKKVVVSHASKISALLKELKSMEADPNKTKFQKQIERVLDHFERQNIAYNRLTRKRKNKQSKTSAGLFKNKKHEDNLPAELNLYKDQHHYSRMLAIILKTMAENYGDEIEPKTLVKINLLVEKVKHQEYFVQKDVRKEFRKSR